MGTTINAQGVEIGPDGKEWAITEAGYRHVDSIMHLDPHGRDTGAPRSGPWWYGWAVRMAFVAGAEWQIARGASAPACRGERIGFAYLATHPESGHLTGMVWDDPERVKLVAKDVAAWIKRGDHVTRVERYKGDPMPTWHSDECDKPPAGWRCSRTKGHTGPCAAREKGGA